MASKPTIGRRALKKETTKSRIVAAALTLFRVKGFDATTTKAIARKARVAEGTVFLKGSTLRASESAVDMQIAIDRLHANLERQVRRYREKRRVEPRRHAEHHNTG